jgi:hypothetical protein
MRLRNTRLFWSTVFLASEIADQLHKALTPGELPEALVLALFKAVGTFISLISDHPENPQAPQAAFESLTSAGLAAFNRKYPQGVPKQWGGEGNEIENGVYYYSWSGIVQKFQSLQPLDPSHLNCIVLSKLFYKEKHANDGLVGQYSSHLAKSFVRIIRWTISTQSIKWPGSRVGT